MASNQIILLGLALALDAAIVAFALGLVHEKEPFFTKMRNGFLTSMIFGFFQFFMMWFGSFAGYIFTFSGYGHHFQSLIGFIFFGIAFKCVKESMESKEREIIWGILPVTLLGFATSIDALASGISLGTIPKAYLPSSIIGVITFLLSGLFYFSEQFFRQLPDRWLLRLAGFIFLFLGFQVFWSIRHIVY
jgi:putative Mn2+ efflux pump MntP